jgi:uncharacterized lipoprotein YbaY
MKLSAALAKTLLVLNLLLVVSCFHHRPPSKPVAAKITGTVTYLQRIALPADATIEVTFSDVSSQDTAPIQLGHQVIPATGKQIPIPFEIAYDGRQIVSSHTYAVAAKIKKGEQVMFASDTPNLVLTQGRSSNIEIIVKAVPPT